MIFAARWLGVQIKGYLSPQALSPKEAVREATRDGAPAIDLIDGDQLVQKLKELSLGVKTEKVEREKVTVDKNWFSGI